MHGQCVAYISTLVLHGGKVQLTPAEWPFWSFFTTTLGSSDVQFVLLADPTERCGISAGTRCHDILNYSVLQHLYAITCARGRAIHGVWVRDAALVPTSYGTTPSSFQDWDRVYGTVVDRERTKPGEKVVVRPRIPSLC
eukprot:scaffold17027_cov106-Amphora_coffeaeformis.AAC.1